MFNASPDSEHEYTTARPYAERTTTGAFHYVVPLPLKARPRRSTRVNKFTPDLVGEISVLAKASRASELTEVAGLVVRYLERGSTRVAVAHSGRSWRWLEMVIRGLLRSGSAEYLVQRFGDINGAGSS